MNLSRVRVRWNRNGWGTFVDAPLQQQKKNTYTESVSPVLDEDVPKKIVDII